MRELKDFFNWVKTRIKWFVAFEEMRELQRWQVQWEEHRRWMASFPDVRDTLDHLRQEVDGVREVDGISIESMANFREKLRARATQPELKRGGTSMRFIYPPTKELLDFVDNGFVNLRKDRHKGAIGTAMLDNSEGVLLVVAEGDVIYKSSSGKFSIK